MENEGEKKSLAISENRHYICGFCEYEFDAIATFSGNNKKNKTSNQIPCPRCTNLIPTWRKAMLPNGSHYHEGR
jgi:DNA-directed RNA polymerase subunit RPC12/RpoP